MPRPAAGRRVFSLRLAVCLAALMAPSLGAQTPGPADDSRLERLEQWASALERHQPGELDDALKVLESWTARDIAELKVTFSSALQLMRDPSTRIFWIPMPANARPSGRRQVFYGPSELRRLQFIAGRLTLLGDNHVLKRAAMLHTDSVVLGSRADSAGGRRRTDFFVFHFNDGQELNQEDAIGHWDMARFMLDRVQPGKDDVRPDPASDDWVRRWYRTAITRMLARMDFSIEIANRGLEIFRDDPELLFLCAVMHETLASPAVQEPLRATDSKLRAVMGVTTRRGELNRAEDLFRRALKRNADFVEARLHLGRVLAELGRHKDAMPELTQALASLKNQTLQYYSHLFAGRSAAALGDAAAARVALERAAHLSPKAQSPLIAMSHLAYSRGDTGEAAALLARVAELPALEGDDPWWSYNTSAGRFYPLSRQDLVETLRAEMPR
jgi:tetratricopeptide (TPR) repeat protein